MGPTVASLMKLLVALSLSLAVATATAGTAAGAPNAASSPVSQLPTVTVPAAQSTNSVNWAGYVAESGSYTSVSGTWSVPSVANPSGNGADATWVGIGGVKYRDLIQAGTEALPSDNGNVTYQAWYELLPSDSHPIPLAISPGDSISVSITEDGSDTWLISFHNNTSGQGYQKEVNYHSSLSSAEWIEEMPVALDQPVTLDNFGTVNFGGSYAIENGAGVTIAEAGGAALQMQNSQHQIVASTSALGVDGSSFSVSRTDATASPLALTRFGTVRPTIAAQEGSATAAAPGTVFRFHRGNRRIVITLF